MNQKEIDKTAIILLSAVLTITLAVLISLIFKFNLTGNLVMGWILTALYAIFVILAYGTDIRREIVEKEVFIEKPIVKFIEKPVKIIKEVIKEVPVAVQIPIENKTIEVVEKPVFRDRVKIVKPAVRKLNIPKYNFVASSQEKRYHARNCRLGKLIKKKFKIHSHNQIFFRKKKYKPCKICLKRK